MIKLIMLVDEIQIELRGGDGGAGKVSFGKLRKSGPDGGNGGDGGNLIIEGSSDLTLLSQFHPGESVSAMDGKPGEKDKKAGKKGEDRLVRLPIGTEIINLDTGSTIEIKETGQKIIIAKGGKGGIGNFELRSPSNTTPRTTIPATKGEVKNVKLILRFVADFGLIGLPSAGKSSLLNELTQAKAKTADYHFTTLSPNLGVLPNKKIIADIPGLIEGAHEGRGLGVKFLKHIEKVKVLLHCISADSDDHQKDYEIIRTELSKYSPKLSQKKEIIIITKTDLLDKESIVKIINKLKNLNKEVLAVSIYDFESIENLKQILN